MEASPIKFGLGATDEIAYDARRLGLKRVLIVTDRHISELGLTDRIRCWHPCDARCIVPPDDRTLIASLAASIEPQSEILEAYLFGSTETGTAHEPSDLDRHVDLGDHR